MKYNLLKMVQLILSSMDSDEINDISDTAESLQVVDIIETVYNENIGEILYPEHKDFFLLEATSGTTPTVLSRPTNVIEMDWFRYNNKLTADTNNDFRDVTFLSIPDFTDRQNSLDIDGSEVEAMTFTNDASQAFVFKILNNKMPQYFTVIGDHYIICDSYISTEESNLQQSNTWAYGRLTPTFTASNTFTPDIDEYNFAQFFNECKAQCFADLKQTINPKTEKKSRDGKIRSQHRKWDMRGELDPIKQFRNFGRK
jgi:hypothetical protein